MRIQPLVDMAFFKVTQVQSWVFRSNFTYCTSSKLQCQLLTFFSLKDLWKKRNKNCEIYYHTTPVPHWQGQIRKNWPNFQKKKSLLAQSNVHEVFHQNCEIHGPCIGVQALERIWSYSENLFNLRKSSFLH